MFRDNWSIDPLSLIGIGLAAWLSYKHGVRKASEAAYKLNEVDALKKQIEDLKAQMEKK